ncbi:hypothetical protein AM500_17380 [Bacillus sp. FJAT-18017]|uniref:hypothetical protein n=1 Tax=Bacillus sp. FJAT-18017 TaxID=1705566 RepID=UPI0006AF04D2|nr:hypothetical protein [Bacillus sp. FJAT-18017]ALC91372.1 hypothetical protein AM500_17380 [Bacillus sp. FJAT-18017]
MAKDLVYYFLAFVFFVIYTIIMSRIFVIIGNLEMLAPYGLLIFLFQLFFTVVIAIPASVLTTKKVVNIIRS